MSVAMRGMSPDAGAYPVRRRESRYISTVPVALQRFLRFGPFVTRGVSLDISERGMSALVCGSPRVGETVVIGLPLQGDPIEVLATVRHSSDAQSGFEFYPLSKTAEHGIREWITELGRHDQKLFSNSLTSPVKTGNGERDSGER